MRNDGSIAMTKLNMSVIDQSAMVSPEALLCASFAQGIIDRAKQGSAFFTYAELEYLDENEEEGEGKGRAEKQVKINYDLTFEMVIAHLDALERQTEVANSAERKLLRETIERERRLLQGSLKILEKNSRYGSSHIAGRYREKLALKKLRDEEKRKRDRDRERKAAGRVNELKLTHKYVNSETEIKELIRNGERRYTDNKDYNSFEELIRNGERRYTDNKDYKSFEELIQNEETIRKLADEIKRRSIGESDEDGNRTWINVISHERRDIPINRYLKEMGTGEVQTGVPYGTVELENIMSPAEGEELAKSTRRAVERQMREIRSLKEILSSVDINTPFRVNYGKADKEKRQGRDYESGSHEAGGYNTQKYDLGEKTAFSYRNIRNVLAPVSREIALNSIFKGKGSAGADSGRILREIIPGAGTRLINEIQAQLGRADMGFEPMNLENFSIDHDLEEKVKEASSLSKKQIREVRELKKILADAELKTPFAKETDRDRKEEAEEGKGTGEGEKKKSPEIGHKEIRIIETKVSEALKKETDRKFNKEIGEKTKDFVRVSEAGKSLQKSIEENASVRNTLSSLTREIAVRNLIKDSSKDDLRNITRLVHSRLPWNDTQAADEIREKYIFRNMGYAPPKLEDILISSDKKDKELEKQTMIGAKREREIRELKATLAARDAEDEQRQETDRRKEEEEEKREKRREEIRRSLEINEKIRNALAPIIREIATIRLMRGHSPKELNNITKLVSTALPGTDTESINAIRTRYASSVMGFRPEKLEDLLIERAEGKGEGRKYGRAERELKDIPGAAHEREKSELRRVVERRREPVIMGDYPPIDMDYGTAYPDLLKRTVKEQVELNLSNDFKKIEPVSRPLSTAEKFIMGEVDEKIIEDIPKPKEQTWVNPMFSPYNKNMTDLSFKEKKKDGEKARENGNPKFSDAEIRRTADKVFKLVEERIRKERRRIGRI